MYKKIDVYINGVYEFSTNRYKTCKELKSHLHQVKHIEVASIPTKYLTIYDYDKVTCKFSK